jgi:tetrahydrodipicolinate N-succinyltransferase
VGTGTVVGHGVVVGQGVVVGAGVTVGAGVVVGIKQQNPTEHPPEKGLQVILAGFGFMTIGLGHTKLAQVIGVVVGHGVVVGGDIVVHGDSGAGGGGAGAGGPSVVHGDASPSTWWLSKPSARR